MKTRIGFVSNSSSSSFIVGIKNDKPLTIDMVKKMLNTSGIIDEIAEKFLDNSHKKNAKNMLYDYDIEPGDDLFNIVNSCKVLYDGYFSNEEGGIEELLCNMDIDYEDDDIIVKKEGGY
jgi:hypothetical protein